MCISLAISQRLLEYYEKNGETEKADLQRKAIQTQLETRPIARVDFTRSNFCFRKIQYEVFIYYRKGHLSADVYQYFKNRSLKKQKLYSFDEQKLFYRYAFSSRNLKNLPQDEQTALLKHIDRVRIYSFTENYLSLYF